MLNCEVVTMQMWDFQGAKWEYQPGVCAICDTHPTLIRVQKGREPIKQSMWRLLGWLAQKVTDLNSQRRKVDGFWSPHKRNCMQALNKLNVRLGWMLLHDIGRSQQLVHSDDFLLVFHIVYCPVFHVMDGGITVVFQLCSIRILMIFLKTLSN